MGDIFEPQMQDVIMTIQQLQQENANMQHALEQLQIAHAQIHVLVPVRDPVLQAPREPRVSLPMKFNGDRTKL